MCVLHFLSVAFCQNSYNALSFRCNKFVPLNFTGVKILVSRLIVGAYAERLAL